MNILATRARREPARQEALRDLVPVFDGYAIRLHDVDHDGVLRVAFSTGLTAHDAAYLWLSRRMGAPLVTLDTKLAAAAAA